MSTPAHPPIACLDLSIGYHAQAPLLTGLTFELSPGETVAIVGESGCGKTTLLKTLAGLHPPLAGQASVLGHTGTSRPPGSLGYIPQDLGLVENATVLRNVLLGTLPRVSTLASLVGRFPQEANEDARWALETVGLAGYEQATTRKLSGGERRRVAIARTLAQRPRALLADEILSELDVTTASTVIDSLAHVQAETGLAVLMVEHNLDVAWEVADEVLCLQDGRIAQRIPTATGTRSDLREAFRGRR